jgi:hypothetical protein
MIEIHNNNIICHIVGINNLIKQTFLNDVMSTYNNIYVCDLDVITNNIRNRKKMIDLINSITNSSAGSKKRKGLMMELNEYWKKAVIMAINKELKSNIDNNIILLGLSTFHRNHRIKIDIPTSNKFLLKVNLKINASEIVEYNIKKFRKFIINGTFPIKHLDHTFLTKQRTKIINIYQSRMNYVIKTYVTLINWLKFNLKNNISKKRISSNNLSGGNENGNSKNINDIDNLLQESDTDYIWIGSLDDYYTNINIEDFESKKTSKGRHFRRRNRKVLEELLESSNGNSSDFKISGYKEEWLALLSSIKDNNKYFRKGYLRKNGKTYPYIEEKIIQASGFINRGGYLYKANRSEFNEKASIYKYKTDHNVEIIKKIEVENILKYLEGSGVKIIKFKSVH